MAVKILLHPVNPHQNQIFKIVDRLRAGDVVALPTDSHYALVCLYSNKKGIERIRSMRNLRKDHLFTLICDSLNGVSKFAHLHDNGFKIIRRLIPGPYTFILPATREVPRLLTHPSRKTIGIRVPANTICEKIMEELKEPVVATTARKASIDDNQEVIDTQDLYQVFKHEIDVFVDDELELNAVSTSILDLTGDHPVLLRQGLGVDALISLLSLTDNELEIKGD